MRNTASSLIVIMFLVLWEFSARLIDKAFILPSPSQILVRLWELKDVLFLIHLPVTLLSIIIGLTLSIILGTTIAVWMSLNTSVQRAIYPILIASQMVPVIALAPIFVL
ncbi:ABC transporter permease, partial [Microvirga sp. 3-52]|nr:ABC transporter permease [Microvirga sp. 3-52]